MIRKVTCVWFQHSLQRRWNMNLIRSPAVQGGGLCWPQGELPVLQLVSGLSCPPQTSWGAQSQADRELAAAERMLVERKPVWFFCSTDLSGRNQHALQNGKGLWLIGTIWLFSHALGQSYPCTWFWSIASEGNARLWLAQATSVCPGPCTYWYTVTHLWYLQLYSIARVLPSLDFPAPPTSYHCRGLCITQFITSVQFSSI